MHVEICCDMMSDNVADCSQLSDASSDSAEKGGMVYGFELRLSYEYQGYDIDRGSGRQSSHADLLFYYTSLRHNPKEVSVNKKFSFD